MLPSEQSNADSLLVEYEVAQNAINAQNQTAWQIGAIFIVASLGVLAFVAQEIFRSSMIPSIGSVALLLVLAVVSWGTLYFWYASYRRWGTFVEVTHRRMHEIEIQLGLWKNRDIEIVDSIIKGRDPDSRVTSEMDADHLEEVRTWALRLNRRQRLTAVSIDVSIRRIVALILFGWLGTIVYHVPGDWFSFSKWLWLGGAFLIPLLWYHYPGLRTRIG